MNTMMDYSVDGMKAWLRSKRVEAGKRDVEKLTLKDAVASIMLVRLIYKYAAEVKKLCTEMRLSQYKKLSRRLEQNICDWNVTMRQILDIETIRCIDSSLEVLEEEQGLNLVMLYFSCKNEVDKQLKKNDSEVCALAWRVVILVHELKTWLNRKVPSRYSGLSEGFEELERIMTEWCGGVMIDTSKMKNTELCVKIFDKALESIEIEYKVKKAV